MAESERSVSARWDGGLRAVVTAGEFELKVDEPETVAGGTNTGPQPTELLLGAVASCFTLAVAHSAGKRQVPLRGLEVQVTGTYGSSCGPLSRRGRSWRGWPRPPNGSAT
jgi:putative redox protein